MNDNIYDIAILGAGASGLMLASLLNNSKQKICIIDTNSNIGARLKLVVEQNATLQINTLILQTI
jgi:predicted flavoprotein YhiN